MAMDKVCRICLKKGSQLEEIENLLKDLLDALLISLDITGPQTSFVCKKCVSQIYELFDFKTLCLYTEDALLPFIEENAGNVEKFDLRSVYSKKELHQFSKSNKKAEICRLCLEITTQWVSLETAVSQASVRDAFRNNLSEISLQSIEHPCICDNCMKMVNCLYNFAIKCKSSANTMQIEINEHLDDCIENDVERSVQRILNSERYSKESRNSDRSSRTEDLNLGSTAVRNTLGNSKKPVSCDSCRNVYNNDVDLALHSISHSENGLYSCHVCKNYADAEKNHMETHIRAHEGKEVEEQCDQTVTSTHSCAICDQMFDTEPIMIEHIERVHGRNICPHCGKKLSQKSGLNSHLLIHTGKKPYVCGLCGKGFTIKSSLKKHLVIHTEKKPHICSYCEKGFSQKIVLKVHSRTHTGEKPFICTHCGNRFSQRNSLNTHLRTHTGEKPHICSHCGNRFSQKSQLTIHLRSHTGEIPFICSHCGKGFSSRSSLNRHLYIHTEEKPHVCGQCGKGFNTKSNLNIHSVIHTRENSFKRKDILNSHLQTHTSEKK